MAFESRMAATKRRRPPQSGHCRTSMSRPRRISSAQLRLYEPTTFLGLLVDDSPSTFALPKSTTSRRHLALGASSAPAANKPKALSAARGD